MLTMIPPYALYGLDAIPADVIVERDSARVIERHTRRALREVKQEPSWFVLAGLQPA
jgi:hypothetical protein